MSIEPEFLHPVAAMRESGAICRFHTQNGYSHFADVFTAAEVAALRAAADRAFTETPNLPASGPRFLNMSREAPEFGSLLLNPRVVRALSTILGDDYLHCDEAGLHADHFAGWHTDTSSPSNAGHDFFWDPGFNVVQVALYLQSNDPVEGGGLDVVPGSHAADDPFCKPRQWTMPGETPPPPPAPPTLVDRALGRLETMARAAAAHGIPVPGLKPDRKAAARARGISIPSRMGDLVMFNLRCGHRATPVGPAARQKRAIFFVCGANNRGTFNYARWLERYHGVALRPPMPREAFVAGFAPVRRPIEWSSATQASA